jgi:predicted RNA-binding Zn ribbon-like protein
MVSEHTGPRAPKRAPRYDVPKAAPKPLLLVQRFINTVDLQHGREWLGTAIELKAWARQNGLAAGDDRFYERDVGRAREAREALRLLLQANGRRGAPHVLKVLERDAAAARLTLHFCSAGRIELVSQASGIDRVLGQLLAIVFVATVDGNWDRLKACRNCRWAFYDYSKNRSARWCSMTICGNRLKTRAYKRRRRR